MKLKLNIPIKWKEKNIIIIPATILNTLELFKKNFPTIDAVDPSIINTKENPIVNKMVLKIIKLLFSLISLSNDVPEIYDMYPGINGKTHGDKKLIKPAKKAKEIVVFIYKFYFYLG